jgi:hypothetical protein
MLHSSMLSAGASDVVSKEQAVSELYGAIQRSVASVQPILILEEEQVERHVSRRLEHFGCGGCEITPKPS